MKRESISWYYSGKFPWIYLGILFTFFPIDGFGQKKSAVLNPAISFSGMLVGRVQDSMDRKSCPLFVVALLQLADSALVQYTRTEADGNFSFQGIPKGIYRIMVSNPYYADYSALVVVGTDSITNLGSLIMVPTTDLLSSVIVISKIPSVYIRGDTLEFRTPNVKLKANATVEELLNRLPGVQIDRNGGITVNGQKVERLLVDGEDLFSVDPIIVTRALNADMIAKVQLFDKKSSQPEFTGVDDGQRIKTVNLTLKKDRRKGYFVKAEGGADPQGYYSANGLFGSFKAGCQLAALAMTSNDGTTSFSGGTVDKGVRLSVGGGGGDALNASAGPGVPRVVGGGLHYANKWNENQDHVTSNYSYGHLLTNPYSTSLMAQELADSIYTQTQNSNSVNNSNQYNFSADLDFIPDSVSDFRLFLSGSGEQGQNQFVSTGSSYFNDTLVNNYDRTIRSLMRNQDFNGNVMYRIRSPKKRERSLSIVLGIAKEDNTTNGYLYDLNKFYHPNGKLLSADTIDERKIIAAYELSLSGSVNVTQPLWRGAILAGSYGLSCDQNQSVQSTYNRGGGKYEDFVDSLSNHCRNEVFTQQTIINLQSTSRPLTYTIGGDIMKYSYRQSDLIGTKLQYHYLNVAPRVNIRYNINKVSAVSFNYSAYTQQASIVQLQPIGNNNDPLHITQGNPNLRPGFAHHFAVGFKSIKPINVTVGINFGFTTDNISTKTFTDSLGRQISQAVNVTGSENSGGTFGINTKLPGDVDFGLNSNLSFTRNVTYVGNLLSYNDNYNAGGGLSIGKYVSENYAVRIIAYVNYVSFLSSVNRNFVTRYWTQNHSAELSYFPLPGLELNINCYYTWRQRTTIFDKNNSTTLCNAFISKNLFKNQLNLRWRINNILEQNVGINRSITANNVSETISNMIGRYWMASAIYRFTKRQQSPDNNFRNE